MLVMITGIVLGHHYFLKTVFCFRLFIRIFALNNRYELYRITRRVIHVSYNRVVSPVGDKG